MLLRFCALIAFWLKICSFGLLFVTLGECVTLGTTISTFQPTPPTTPTTITYTPTFPTLPTVPTTLTPSTPTTPTTITTTPVNCPVFPVICLPGGIRPNPNCPCIDPRNTNGLQHRAGPIGSEMMIFSSLDSRRRRRRRRRSVPKN